MRIAVVGSGIAGAGAAHLLDPGHDVELFERDVRLGGHTHTVDHVGGGGEHLALDTGFLVHNPHNYPNLIRLFDELGVRTQDSDMSFSVSCGRCGLEYSGARPWAMGRNLRSPSYLRLMREIVRFMRTAEAASRGAGDDVTLRAFARSEGYSQAFLVHFLAPLTSAIWSTAPGETGDFPARYAIAFFANHGMLRLRRFTWRTVVGGSRTYLDRILERFGGAVHAGLGVRTVRRTGAGVELVTDDGATRAFDAVVMAAHPDQSLAMLADPSDDERRILGAFTYMPNETVLHTDTAMMPAHPGAHAAWNYRITDCTSPAPTLTVTYDLNRLQRLGTPERYLVSLNRGEEIDPSRVIRRIANAHPRYTPTALRAQREVGAIQGVRGTWYCGAWQGAGFHEDGFASAVRVARALGAAW